jgi:Ca2+-binding RTX toxin-like protein
MAKIKKFSISSTASIEGERETSGVATRLIDTITTIDPVVTAPTIATISAEAYEANKAAATKGITAAAVAKIETADLGSGSTTTPSSSASAIKSVDAISTVAPTVDTSASVAVEPSLAVSTSILTATGAGVSGGTTKVASGGTPSASGSTNTMDIGMNLAGVSYYGTQYPFLDRFKTSSKWVAQFSNGLQTDAIPVDANGFPTGMPAGAFNLYAGIGLDPAGLDMPDVYVITYKGTANITVISGTILSSEPGKVVFRYTGDGNAAVVSMTQVNPADPVTEMHVVRQDQMALYNSGEIFNPAFLDKASQWSELRYMDWGNTNNNKVVSWDQRTKVENGSWASNSQTSSVPIEIMVALANKTNTNMWINIPAEADDTYVRNTLAYVRDHLASGLSVKVEYSNEVWNWGFQQAGYAREKAAQLWGTDLNGNGQIDPNTNEEATGGYLLYYGYRSAQVAAIANDVFGASAATRLENVISTQTGYLGLEDYVFQGVQKAKLGNIEELFDAYAVTTYFNIDAAAQSAIIGWAHAGQAGIDAAFGELTSSLNDNVRIYMYQQAVAARNGLSLVAYEGGLHITSYVFPDADQAAVTALFDALSKDPRMGTLYTQMVADFASAGGSGLAAFSDAVPSSKWGNWGTLDSIYDTSSPRYDALVAASQAAKISQLGGGDATQVNVRTTSAAYTLAASQLTLTYIGLGSFNGRGNDSANTIVGGGAFNMLYGGGGNDTLIGGNRNDMIDGGTGADRMIGAGGDDTYTVDNDGDVVVELPGGGTDEVRTVLRSYALTANVENLTFLGTGAFTGTGNELANVITATSGPAALYGGGGDDRLFGSASADILDGGTGADYMRGGQGNDLYYVDNANDEVIELTGGGLDTIRTTLNRIILADQVENLTFTGVGNFEAFGNTLDNFVLGGAGNDSLWGDAGNDTLYGRAGNDDLIGGLGADLMNGGGGDDRYDVDDIGDMVVEAANQGNDTVYSTISYTLTANVENLMLRGTDNLNGTGNDLNNQISGNDGDNILSGGAGNDSLQGGGGHDTLYGGDGDDFLNGGDGNDLLHGGAGKDLIYGGAGNDVIVGGAGIDTLDGGSGADRYVFYAGDSGPTRATADFVVFSSSEGDLIDLSNMDARTSTPSRDAFSFIGQSAFTRTAGELRIQYSGGHWDVLGDTNGDGIADFSITVSAGSTAMLARDFIL